MTGLAQIADPDTASTTSNTPEHPLPSTDISVDSLFVPVPKMALSFTTGPTGKTMLVGKFAVAFLGDDYCDTYSVRLVVNGTPLASWRYHITSCNNMVGYQHVPLNAVLQLNPNTTYNVVIQIGNVRNPTPAHGLRIGYRDLGALLF